MTGPEHYRDAERLLTAANRKINDAEWLHPPVRRAELRAEAQVHATLALAAATALVMGDNGNTPLRAYDAWAEVAGEPREPAPAAPGRGEP